MGIVVQFFRTTAKFPVSSYCIFYSRKSTSANITDYYIISIPQNSSIHVNVFVKTKLGLAKSFHQMFKCEANKSMLSDSRRQPSCLESRVSAPFLYRTSNPVNA